RQYYFHMFYKEQPDLNWRNPEVRKAVLDVFRFWLKRGVDGFRLDVFNVYFKDKDFRNNPPKLGLRGFDRQEHLHDIDQPELLPLLEEIRSLLDSYPERYAVGETFLATAERAARYAGSKLLHGSFNFEFMNSEWKPDAFLNAIQRWEGLLAQRAFPTYVLNNHDTPRSSSRFGQGEDDERLKVAAALLLTLRGTPFLYYGEEIGMRDIRLKRSQIKDPVGRRYWPFFKGRDGCRSPMQWDDSPNAGFSAVQPWLPVHANYCYRNVRMQAADSSSLYHFYRRLIRLRRQYHALRQGMFLPLAPGSNRVLAFLRQTEEQSILVALNFSNRPQRLALGGSLALSSWELLLSNCREQFERPAGGELWLDPNEAMALIQR
ncbi:MAG: alpha-amylase family glycosyl hydrolase, partial [Anaerolineaceae bacterium]|nr:alpha-amylase family glycosyl hydrolase [Anaerolineaceae bacterium]